MIQPKDDGLPFPRARALTFFPVPPDWIPSIDEKLWLEELENLSPEAMQELERFSPPADGAGLEVFDEETGEWRPFRPKRH